MGKLFIIVLATFAALPLQAQSARDEIFADLRKAGGQYFVYQGPQRPQTPAPKGYKPFYISHFGRHGSRWNTADWVYTDLIATFSKADSASALTPLGKEVFSKVQALWADAKGRIGELTPLGIEQHREVAGRMYESFPEAFKGEAKVSAASTTSPRVMISMFAFCDELVRRNPDIRPEVSASHRDEKFVANRSRDSRIWQKSVRWQNGYDTFAEKHLHPERIVSTLFSDSSYVKENVDGRMVYNFLFDAATITQNCPDVADIDLYGIFTKEELYQQWLCHNYDLYTKSGPGSPALGDTLYRAALNMLRHIIDTADKTIAEGGNGATLRFSHDSYLVPLATCMRLDGCGEQVDDEEKYCEAMVNFRICPMCANIQVIFLRNRSGDVIVKFLLNENEVGIPLDTDIYPYYRWSDVRKFYTDFYNL